jgi:hypothetical protein
MRNFFISVLTSGGKISSKRFITILSFIMMVVGFVANMFFQLKIEQYIYESMSWIVLGGLGFTASEQFAKKTPKSNDSSTELN